MSRRNEVKSVSTTVQKHAIFTFLVMEKTPQTEWGPSTVFKKGVARVAIHLCSNEILHKCRNTFRVIILKEGRGHVINFIMNKIYRRV